MEKYFEICVKEGTLTEKENLQIYDEKNLVVI